MRSEVADLQATFTTGACKFSQLTHNLKRNNETINQLVDQHTITQFTYSKIQQYVLVIYHTKLVPVSKM